MGLGPNLINFTCMIEGLCKRGSMKQAFEMLEEMVGIVTGGLTTGTVGVFGVLPGLCFLGGLPQ